MVAEVPPSIRERSTPGTQPSRCMETPRWVRPTPLWSPIPFLFPAPPGSITTTRFFPPDRRSSESWWWNDWRNDAAARVPDVSPEGQRIDRTHPAFALGPLLVRGDCRHGV